VQAPEGGRTTVCGRTVSRGVGGTRAKMTGSTRVRGGETERMGWGGEARFGITRAASTRMC